MGTDKRVRYTRMFLRESLIRLMREKPISRITVKELCEGAEINRATFYAHYRDQYDLLEQTERELIADVNRCIDSLVEAPDQDHLRRVVLEIIHIIDKNLECVRVLWGKNGDMQFQENMARLFHDQLISLLPKSNKENALQCEFICLYTIHGCIGILRQWIYGDHDKITPEQLADMILRISNASALIGP